MELKKCININPYIDIMVDELFELSDSILFDAYKKAPFRCKVAILLYVLDYPGMEKWVLEATSVAFFAI